MQTQKLFRRSIRLFSTLGFRVIGAGLNFTLNVLLGRTLGAAGSGSYFLFLSWMNLFTTAGNLGLPLYTLRMLSRVEGSSPGANAQRRAFILACLRRVLLVSLPGAAVIAALSVPLSGLLLGSGRDSYIFTFAALAAFLMAMLRILGAYLKTTRRIELSLTLEASLVPAGLILVTLVLSRLLDLRVWHMLVAYTLILLFVVLTALVLWLRFTKNSSDAVDSTDTVDGSNPVEVAAPTLQGGVLFNFWILGFLNSLQSNLPFYFLPFFATTFEIGQFGVVYKVLGLASTILLALQGYYAPRFSSYYNKSQVTLLRKSLLESQVVSLLAFSPVLFLLLVFPDQILSIFGDEFRVSRSLIWAMAIGEFVNSASGLVGTFLNMVDSERAGLLITLASLALVVVLMLVLGQRMGVLGVAIGYASGQAVTNFAKFVLCYVTLDRMKRGQHV